MLLQAKLNALGGPGQPAMDDVEVLRSFVEKYDLTSKIGTAWPSLLNEEESLLLTSNIGECGSPLITETGIFLAAQVLLMAWEFCTKRNVDGQNALYNPTTKASYALPCFDQDDYQWVAFIKNISITANHYDKKPNFDIVLVDEGADSTKLQILRSEQLTRTNGTTVNIFDHMQRAYDWVYGSPEELQRFINESYYMIDMKNWRSALNLYDLIQEMADKFQMGVTIEPMSDKYGMVTYNSNLNNLTNWLADGKTVRIGCRLNAPLYKLFGHLLGKTFNVHLNGMDPPANMLEKLMNELKPNSAKDLQSKVEEKKKMMTSLQQVNVH